MKHSAIWIVVTVILISGALSGDDVSLSSWHRNDVTVTKSRSVETMMTTTMMTKMTLFSYKASTLQCSLYTWQNVPPAMNILWTTYPSLYGDRIARRRLWGISTSLLHRRTTINRICSARQAVAMVTLVVAEAEARRNEIVELNGVPKRCSRCCCRRLWRLTSITCKWNNFCRQQKTFSCARLRRPGLTYRNSAKLTIFIAEILYIA